jgi:hypothetical protein
VALAQLSDQDTLSAEDLVTRFIASLIPVHQFGALHTADKHNLIVVHTLAQAALIRLFYLRAEVDQLWNEKCVLAARGMLLVIGQVSDMDLEFLDPIVGVSLYSTSLLVFSPANSECSVAGPQLRTYSSVRSPRWSHGRRLHPTNSEAMSGPLRMHCRGLV